MNFDDISSDVNPIDLFSTRAFGVTSDQVRLIQTHISWVVLAGAYAYKLKKPVAFPFLDYGSLQKRQQFVVKEMERNRNWAGSLYLDVVGLHGKFGEVVFGDATDEVEWCLRMHRFDQEDCLLRHAEHGLIPRKWIDDLAEHFVAAHAAARPAAVDSPWGTAQSLSLQLDQCCLDIEVATKKMGVSADPQRIDAILQARLRTIEPILSDRKKQGFIRECHGDLHLGNLIRWQGHTVGFDAIEFNPDFFWIDVWNDVAFTIMDLDWHKQKENAARLTNAYAESTGDYAGLAMLSVFLAYRALVRSRIAALRVQQNTIDSDVARFALRDMLGYLELANGYLHTESPMLFITHGVSGSGKSKGSERCIESRRAIRIRTDVERKRLAGIDRLAAGDERIYTVEFTKSTYQRCIDLARQVLAAGFSVVIDGTFLKGWQRELAYNLGREMSVQVEILDFDAPVNVLKERISRRTADPSDATLDVLARQLAEREPLSEMERSLVRNSVSLSSDIDH